MKKRTCIYLLKVAGMIFVIWIVSITINEVQTFSHGDEFSDGYKATNMIDSVDGLKVLSYSNSYAKVYYYSFDKQSGGIGLANGYFLSFIKKDGMWELSEWDFQRWDDYVQWPYLFFTFGGQTIMLFFGVSVLILVFMLHGCIKKEKALKSTVEAI